MSFRIDPTSSYLKHTYFLSKIVLLLGILNISIGLELGIMYYLVKKPTRMWDHLFEASFFTSLGSLILLLVLLGWLGIRIFRAQQASGRIKIFFLLGLVTGMIAGIANSMLFSEWLGKTVSFLG